MQVSAIARPTVGFVGVGLMGHGLAKNIAAKGWPLLFLDHPGNQPTHDIEGHGGRPVATLAEIGGEAETILLCVTGTPQVEEIVLGTGGLLEHLHEGQTLVDCSTALPESTLKVAAAVEAKAARFLDAPLTRTPKEAEEGRANVLVGGDEATFRAVLPILQAFAENVVHVGGVGAGHRMKLLHNCISLGFVVLLAEAAVTARRGGLDMDSFIDVLARGGGDGVALKRLAPYLLQGDVGALRFSLANGAKDLTYYTAMADALGAPSSVAKAVRQVLAGAVELGQGDDPVPKLVDLLDQRTMD